MFDTLVIGHMHMEELRSLASRKTGLPVGIFRLVTKDGTEMYDGHRLEDYGIDVGHTVWLENLDGWNEFLNLAIMGFTPQVCPKNFLSLTHQLLIFDTEIAPTKKKSSDWESLMFS